MIRVQSASTDQGAPYTAQRPSTTQSGQAAQAAYQHTLTNTANARTSGNGQALRSLALAQGGQQWAQRYVQSKKMSDWQAHNGNNALTPRQRAMDCHLLTQTYDDRGRVR